MIRALLIAWSVIAIDAFTKNRYATDHHAGNTDFALGIPAPGHLVTVAIMFAGIFLFSFFFPPTTTKLSDVAVGLYVGGAVANMIERFREQSVTDPFHVGPVAFNLADVALIIGVALVFVDRRRARRGVCA